MKKISCFCERGHALRIAVGIMILTTLLLAGSAGAQTNISQCTTISEPGTFMLNQSIINSTAASCINITSSDVIFDGAGYTIDGIYTWNSTTQTTYGVSVYSTTALVNVTVKNLNVTEWHYGIYYYNTSNVSIINNNATSNGIGIQLESYSFLSILHHIVSSNNTLTNNTANLNSYGLYLTGIYHSTLNNNSANSNGYGIRIYFSSNNTFTNNNVISNMDTGIYLSSSNNNSIYHNNFVNNSLNVYNYYTRNFWDNGYPSGGNYWSDFNGSDNFSGLNQDQQGSDGIGDVPYNISGGSGEQDKYPLMAPYGELTQAPAPMPAIVTGVLSCGVEAGCVVLIGDDGNTYELGVSNNIPFGSRVRVTAIRLFEVLSFCMQGMPLKVLEITTLSIGEDVVLRYAGSNCILERVEVVQAVMDFFAGRITRQDAIAVVTAYFQQVI